MSGAFGSNPDHLIARESTVWKQYSLRGVCPLRGTWRVANRTGEERQALGGELDVDGAHGRRSRAESRAAAASTV